MGNTDIGQLPLLDDETFAELRDIMEDEFIRLVNRFLDDLPIQLDHLHRAVLQGSTTDVHRIAHKLKSSCGNLGTTRLTEWVRQLELAGRQDTLDGVAEALQETRAVAEKTIALLQAQLS
ncbi:MAG: Hpt domain-containing protein [Gammaproteobacteria bacterium]|nr:Hpt domain-containing protein [Gammaproteobacteria bacterium]